MIDKLISRFEEIFNRRPEVYSSAPGRINIIGEHTDYNNGYVLPAAIERRTHVLLASREDKMVVVFSENLNQWGKFDLNNLQPKSKRNWLSYVEAIFWVLKDQGQELTGADILIKGDVPLEAGLSSSASLEISLLKGLLVLIKKEYPPKKIALLGQKAENEYVGVRCGLMDQFIAVLAEPASALFLDCETLDYHFVPLRLQKENLVFLVYDTRVPRQLAGSKYNDRRLEAQLAREILEKRGYPSLKTLTLNQLEACKEEIDPVLFRRVKHIITENQRVLQAREALEKDNFSFLGELLYASHLSLKEDYEVSCPELDLFVEVARSIPDCLGARLVGAGFGGSAIALIKEGAVNQLINKALKETSKNNFPKPEVLVVSVGTKAFAYRL
ncbi:MAG: galactokinase [Candidatus Aminicenantes bacterium]|nr:galactokinase [Candidatus Aminicenantes bacterium]